MKITILFNPSAGGGKARRILDEAVEVLRRGGVEPQILESHDSQHLVELARKAREQNPDVMVAAGGDGTVHYVVNGLFPDDIPLGIIPLGRGNDFARGLGIPFNPREAAKILLKGAAREIDLAQVRGADDPPQKGDTRPVVYMCIGGVGFDSVVNRYANDRARRVHGRLAYLWGILRCLKSYRAQPLELISDGRNYSGEIMFAVAGNNTSYGDGVKMTPRARLDDGRLDVCIVPRMSKWELLRWIPSAYRGRHLAHPRIVYFQASRITLRSTAPLELFGDGEFLQELPATIEVMGRALRVMVPR
ncbi:MAG TPA: diacylglycerol kinase family protein [Terriglobia bacterium]|nr:diacylglycerol kinase family protein [Terriglobia bacterium]